MRGNQFAQTRDFGLARINGRLHGSDVAFDDHGDVATAELLFADDVYVGCFASAVDGLEHGSEALRLDKTQGERYGVTHGGFLVLGGKGNVGWRHHDDILLDQRIEFDGTMNCFPGFVIRAIDHVADRFTTHLLRPGMARTQGCLDGVSRTEDLDDNAQKIVQLGLVDGHLGRLVHDVQGDQRRSEAGGFQDAERLIHSGLFPGWPHVEFSRARLLNYSSPPISTTRIQRIMSRVTIYHNPRCTKSRQTLELLRQHGIEPQVIEYLRTPPDAPTLRGLLKKLGLAPQQLIRRKEHAALGLPDTADPEELIARMVSHPEIIERPIVAKGNQARLGRPPEQVLELL